jgi:hypothetical protein
MHSETQMSEGELERARTDQLRNSCTELSNPIYDPNSCRSDQKRLTTYSKEDQCFIQSCNSGSRGGGRDGVSEGADEKISPTETDGHQTSM